MASGSHKKVGSFIGTGVAKDISLDFTPRYVRIVNMTDLESAEKFAESDIATKEGGVSVDVAGAMTALTASAGISLGERKFTVGTDNSCNGATDHLCYVAEE